MVDFKIFISERMSAIPILELGGVFLNAGDRLCVRNDIADKLVAKYGRLLIEAGSGQKERLSNGGIYEFIAQHRIQDFAMPIKDSANKSMVGKRKSRTK